jgi:eukaryotic-like serine/threonine-protein kinase
VSAPASEGLRVGSQFGVYAVGECIGRGAMGQVYRAEHTLLEKTVALKIMASAARNSFTGQHRFVREARAAAAIKHPNVVDILDMGVLDGFPFIVMEFLEGQDLETHLKRHGTLTDRQLADLALPIIAALGAVHDAGVVHRDIKPSNIFLSKGTEEDLVPKVLDFGISKALQRDGESTFIATGPEDLVGTPLYISPEALRGSQYLTAKSDQYSLGVVLYECATGRRPHEGKDLGKLVNSILNDPVEPLRRLNPSVSVELEAAILRAISRRPEDRFDHVRDLGTALWSLASKRTQHVWAKRFSDLAQSFGAPSIPVTSPPSERVSTPLWARAAVSLLILVAAGMASIAWFRARSAPTSPAAASPAPTSPAAASPAAASPAAASPAAASPAQLALTPKAAPQPAALAPERAAAPSGVPRAPEPEAVPPPSASAEAPPTESPAPSEQASGPQQGDHRSSQRAVRHAAPSRRAAAKSVAVAGVQRRALLERRAAPSASEPASDPGRQEPPSTPAPAQEPSESSERGRRGANQSPILD